MSEEQRKYVGRAGHQVSNAILESQEGRNLSFFAWHVRDELNYSNRIWVEGISVWPVRH